MPKLNYFPFLTFLPTNLITKNLFWPWSILGHCVPQLRKITTFEGGNHRGEYAELGMNKGLNKRKGNRVGYGKNKEEKNKKTENLQNKKKKRNKEITPNLN